MTDSGRDSDLIYRFDGRQAAKIPDWVVPQNLTDHFTIATWMKHGPSPGLRAEKETLLCNSDKTGECESEREGVITHPTSLSDVPSLINTSGSSEPQSCVDPSQQLS